MTDSLPLADSSTEILEVLRDKIKTREANDMEPIKLDMTSDPLPNKQFDLVYTI